MNKKLMLKLSFGALPTKQPTKQREKKCLPEENKHISTLTKTDEAGGTCWLKKTKSKMFSSQYFTRFADEEVIFQDDGVKEANKAPKPFLRKDKTQSHTQQEV